MEIALTALAISIIAAAIGDILMSKGMKEIGSVSIKRLDHVVPLVKRVFTSHYILRGLAAMCTYFIFFAAAMASLDVSVVVPMTALSYVITIFYLNYFMHERVNAKRWTGVVILTAGAILVGLSS